MMNDLPSRISLATLIKSTERRRNIVHDAATSNHVAGLFTLTTSLLQNLATEFGETVVVHFSPWGCETRDTFDDIWYSDTKFRQCTVKVFVGSLPLTELNVLVELEDEPTKYTFEDLVNPWSVCEMKYSRSKEQAVSKPSKALLSSGLLLSMLADREKFVHKLREEFSYLLESLVKDHLVDVVTD